MQFHELINIKAKLRHDAHQALMNQSLRQCLCLLTALSIAVLGMGAPSSASQMGAVEMVICGADGPQTVVLDPSGNPVDPAAKCCECLDCLLITALVDPAKAPLAHDETWQRVAHPLVRSAKSAPRLFLRPMPRAPPLTTPLNSAQVMGQMYFASLEFSQFKQVRQSAGSRLSNEVQP